MELPYVHFTVAGNIGRIQFYHPQHNALPGDLLRQLAVAFQAADADERVHIVLLSSAGDRSFCAGANFDELLGLETPDQGKEFFSGFGRVILVMRSCRKPVIARVQGKAVGGGVGLAAAADIVFASQHASIRLSELAIGIGPFVIGPAVERKTGISAFTALALQPERWLTAEKAKQIGLYTELFDTIESLDSYLEEYLSAMASYHPLALMQIKQMLWENTDGWEKLMEDRAAQSGTLVLSDFTRKALNAFKSKS